MKNHKTISLIFTVLILMLLCSGCIPVAPESSNGSAQPPSETTLKVAFLDVGQGSATLLSHDGAFALIDTGDTFAKEALLTDLDEAGVSELDYVIISHPHSDHMANLDDVLENYTVNTVVINEMAYDSNMWNHAVEILEETGVPTLHPMAGDTFRMGDILFRVCNPTQDPNDYSETNDSSIVVKVSYGSDDFMFCGDATVYVENELLYQFGTNLDVEVYAVAHHGSHLSNSLQFLAALTPEYYVISAGKNNQYGHPDKETLDRMEDVGGIVYRTDIDDTVIMESNGDGITVK